MPSFNFFFLATPLLGAHMYTSLQYTTMTHPIEEQKTGLMNDTIPNLTIIIPT